MWIWIGYVIVVWIACGIICLKMLWNVDGDFSCWPLALFGPIYVFVMLLANGKDCFKKGKKMEKVYWNEKEQQIMTKSGKCLFDKHGQSVINDSVAEVFNGRDNTELALRKSDKFQAQLQCAAKGHGKWMYQGEEGDHIFKCSDCGLEITKTKEELKPAECAALKSLQLL